MRIAGLITGSVSVPRAIHIYRITLPLAYVNSRTKHEAVWTDSVGAGSRLTNEQIHQFLGSDIIVLGRPITRCGADIYDYMKVIRSNNSIVVYEMDDDLTEEHRDISDGRGMTCIPFLQACDAVTVTTEHLARLAKNYTDAPVFVLPNNLECHYWNQICDSYERKYNDGINLMFVGTATHGNDWQYAARAVKRIMREFPQTRLLLGGYHPDYIDWDGVIKLDYVDYAYYPTVMKEADIVIAAIDPSDPFNHSKSAVKAMESWAAKRRLPNGKYGGAALVATRSVVYNGTVKDGKNGLLVSDDEESYYEALKALINNESLRHKLQVRGKIDVARNHDIRSGYKRWASVYNQIYRRYK